MAQDRMSPQKTGGFKLILRGGQHYEVVYKSYAPGISLVIAYGLTKTEAIQLKDLLETTLEETLTVIEESRQ